MVSKQELVLGIAVGMRLILAELRGVGSGTEESPCAHSLKLKDCLY